jgi:4-amino-4-deoxy-L-arabinose transferase-like glycosyltransferase
VTSIRFFFKSHLALTLLLSIVFLTIFTGLDDSVLQVDEGADTFVSTTILKYGLPMHSDGLNHTMPYADIFDGVFVYRTWIPYYLQSISLYFFGNNTFAARFPFAVAGFFSIWCLYHLTIRLTQKKSVAVFATTFLATCVPALLYFRTARYVAIPILLTPIVLSFYIDIFENKKWNPIPFTVSSIIFFHTMYVEFAGLIIGMLIHLFIYRKEVSPDNLRKIRIPAAITVLLCLPWLLFLPALSKQIAEFYTSSSPYIDTSSLGYLKHFLGFLFQVNNYIFPLILVPFIVLLPIKKFSRPISLLFICNFFILLTASLHSIPQLQYIAASIPIFFILLGWINLHLFKSSVFQQSIFAAFLIFSNLVHVAPLIPFKQLILPPQSDSKSSLYLEGLYQAFMREVKFKFIFLQYWGELANPYRGPLNKIVAYFETHGKKGETCYIDNELESLAFYTGFKMIHNSELTNKSIPDWIILRGDQWAFHLEGKASPLKNKLRFILRNNQYEQFELNAPVKRVNNSYEIQIHLFKSPISADKVYIFRRSDKI